MSDYKRFTKYEYGCAMALSKDGKREFSDTKYRHVIERLAELEGK